MTSNCIAAIESDLPDHKLELALMWDSNANTLESRTYTGLERRDTGKRERRSGKPRIFAHNFCPFCGTRYEAPAQEGGEA